MNRDISSLRRDYQFDDLLETDVPNDPMTLFDSWLEQAILACPDDPTAMVLSTVDSDCRPHARVVLLKQRDQDGFIFFTNYNSNKGKELATNSNACLTFFWPAMSRQIRIEGQVHKVDRLMSQNYFASRPKASQIAASVSPQSQVIVSREALQQDFEQAEQSYLDQEVPCPEHWGGYLVEAASLEFWQGRPSRLHDRLYFSRTPDGWIIQRKAP